MRCGYVKVTLLPLFLDLDAQIIINLPFIRDVVSLLFDVLDGLVNVGCCCWSEEEAVVNINEKDHTSSVLVHTFVNQRLGEAGLE